jgi:hypothetical protein
MSPTTASRRRASNLVWLVPAGIFAASLIPASTTCSFWHRGGALWSAVAVGLAAAAALSLRGGGLLVSLCVGAAVGFVVFVAVAVAFLAFAGCTA